MRFYEFEAKRLLARQGVRLPDGGRMQDDATFKQAQVMVQTARLIAERNPEYAELYGSRER